VQEKETVSGHVVLEVLEEAQDVEGSAGRAGATVVTG